MLSRSGRVTTWLLGLVMCVATPALVVVSLEGGITRAVLLLGVFALALAAVVLPARAFTVAAATVSLLIEVLVPVNQVPQYGQLKYIGAAGGVLTLVALLRVQRAPQLAPTALTVAVFATFLPSTLSTGDPFATKLLLTTGLVASSLVALVTTFDGAQRLWLARVVVAAALGEALYGYREFHDHLTPLWFSYSTDPSSPSAIIYRGEGNALLGAGTVRAQGTLAHPLLLGLLAAVAIALLLTMPIVKHGLVRWAAVAVLAGVFVISGTRTYIVVLPVVLLFLFTRRDRLRAGRLGFGLAQALVAILGLWAVGFFHSRPVQVFLSSSSATHRTSMISSASYLQSHESFSYLLAGSGYASSNAIFDAGRLPLDEGLRVIDDQFISTLAMSGLIGLAVLVALLIWTFRRATPQVVVPLAVIVLTFFSFDVLLWPSATALFAIAVGFASPIYSSIPAARTRTVPEVRAALIRT